MKRSSSTILILTLVLGVTLLAAKPWEKPFRDWNRNVTLKVLNDSPWAEQYTQAASIISRGSGISGEKGIFQQFTVRFFSALPVRQAYVRMLQLMNNYDSLSGQEQEAFDMRFDKALEMDMSDQIIVALEFETNDAQLQLEVDRFLKTGRTQLLKQNAFLITDSNGRVQLKEYFPPSPDGTGAKFIFPRQLDGQPVVQESDREVKFELEVPNLARVFIRKKIKDMIYKGELAI